MPKIAPLSLTYLTCLPPTPLTLPHVNSVGTKEIGSIHRDQQDLFKYYEKEATLWLEGDVIKITKNENHHYLALVVTSYVINSIVILAALFCFIFTIAYRNRR